VLLRTGSRTFKPSIMFIYLLICNKFFLFSFAVAVLLFSADTAGQLLVASARSRRQDVFCNEAGKNQSRQIATKSTAKFRAVRLIIEILKQNRLNSQPLLTRHYSTGFIVRKTEVAKNTVVLAVRPVAIEYMQIDY